MCPFPQRQRRWGTIVALTNAIDSTTHHACGVSSDDGSDMFRILSLVGALLIGVTQGASPAMAQEYPKKQPIKIVVAFSAGGLTDVLGRYPGQDVGQPSR